MDPEIRTQFDETRRHVDEVASEVRELRAQAEETSRHVGELAGEVRAQAEETRRHFDVVAEGMRADVRLVAEGVVSLAERVDRVEENLREEIRETRRDLTALMTARR